MSKIMIVGAGKTGRGYLARLLKESDKEICFVDKDEQLIKKLQEKKCFHIHFFGEVREDFAIDNYSAVTWDDADFTDVSLILISVGGSNLMEVGNALRKKLSGEHHYDIITCENSSKPAQVLASAIGNDLDISVSESTVFCTTIEAENGGLDINSENYPYLQCNADLLPGFVSDIDGIRPLKEFGDFLTRKLYTYNAASCVLAYLGFLKGYTDYRDAGKDPEILEKLDRNYKVTNQILCEVYGYDPKDQEEFALLSRNKFTSQVIADTIDRNAREPQRKLQDKERIIGPMKLMYEHGIMPDVLIETAAAALLYDKGEAWLDICSSHTTGEILEEICGLHPGDFLYEEILKKYKICRDSLL